MSFKSCVFEHVKDSDTKQSILTQVDVELATQTQALAAIRAEMARTLREYDHVRDQIIEQGGFIPTIAMPELTTEIVTPVDQLRLPKLETSPEVTEARRVADKLGLTYVITNLALKATSLTQVIQALGDSVLAMKPLQAEGITSRGPFISNVITSLGIDFKDTSWKKEFADSTFHINEHLANSTIGTNKTDSSITLPRKMWKTVKVKMSSPMELVRNIFAKNNSARRAEILRTSFNATEKQTEEFASVLNRMRTELIPFISLKELSKEPFWPAVALNNPLASLSTVEIDGTRKLDQNILAAMGIAGFEWLSVYYQGNLNKSESDVLRALGLNSDDELSAQAAFYLGNSGDTRNQMARKIGRNIVKMLGVAPTAEMKALKPNVEDALAESLGLATLDAMHRAGFLNQITVTREDMETFIGVGHQDTIFYRVNTKSTDMDHPDFYTTTDKVNDLLAFLEDIHYKDLLKTVLGETEAKHPNYKPLKPSYEIRKTGQKATALSKKVLDKYAKTGFRADVSAIETFLTMPISAWMTASTERKSAVKNAWLSASGYRYDLENVGILKYKTVRGKNISIEKEFDDAIEFIEKLTQGEKGIDTPFYFNWSLAKNSRVNMIGAIVNPQSSKLHRHLFKMPNQIHMPIKNTPDNIIEVKRAIGAAFGIEADKASTDEMLVAFDELLASKLIRKAVDSKMTPQTLGELFSKYEETSILDGISAIKEYEAALKEKRDFDISISIETDATTSGLVIGLLQFTTALNTHDKGLLAAGGYHVDGVTTDQVEYKRTNPDNYRRMALALYRSLAGLIDPTTISPGILALSSFIGSLVETKDGKTVYDANGNPKISSEGRAITKNPTTIFNYGAGEKKIKADIFKHVLESIATEIQKLIDLGPENHPQRVQDLQAQLQSMVDEAATLRDPKFGNPVATAHRVTLPTTAKGLREFDWNSETYNSIQQLSDFTYGQGLIDAIEATYPSIKLAKESFLKINEAITHNYINEFEKAYDAALLTRAKMLVKQGKNAFLAILGEEDVAKIKKDLQSIAPIYHSPSSKTLDDAVLGVKYEQIPISHTNNDLVGGQVESSALQFLNAIKREGLLSEKQMGMTEAQLMRDFLLKQGFNNTQISFKEAQAPSLVVDLNKANLVAHDKKSLSAKMTALRETPAQAGPSALTDMVQGIEAHHIQTLMLQADVLGVHDASYSGPLEAPGNTRMHNQATIDINRDYSFAEQVMATYDRIVAQGYDLTNNAVFDEGLPEALTNMAAIAVNNKEVRKRIFEPDAKKGESTVVTHVVIADSEVRLGAEIKPDALGSGPVSNDNFNPTEFHDLTSHNTMEMFDRVGNLGNVTDTEEHTEHLRTVMQTITDQVLTARDTLALSIEHKVEQKEDQTIGEYYGKSINMAIADSNSNTANKSQLSGQEVYTHEYVHAIVQFGLKNSTYLTKRARRLFNAAKQQLTYVDLIRRDADGNPLIKTTYADEVQAAKDRYDYIFHHPKGLGLDEFIAFGVTNAQFKEKLSKVRPKDAKDDSSVEKKLIGWLVSAVAFLTGAYFKINKGNPADELLAITIQLGKINTNYDTKIAKLTRGVEAFNAQLYEKGAAWIVEPLTKFGNNGNSIPRRFVKTGVALPRLVGSPEFTTILDSVFRNFDDMTLGVMKAPFEVVQNVGRELRGRTAKTQAFMDLLRKALNKVDAGKEVINKTIQNEIVGSFLSDTSEDEFVAMYHSVLKSDLVDLRTAYSQPEIWRMMSDEAYLQAQIDKVTAELQQFGPNAARYAELADSLGHFMITMESTAHNHMNNPYAIAQRFDLEPDQRKVTDPDTAEEIISRLKSLYAVKYTDPDHKARTVTVLKREWNLNKVNNGLVGTLDYIQHHRKLSLARLFEGNKTQVISGYHTEQHDPEIALAISTNPKDPELLRDHYVRIDSKSLGQDPHHNNKNYLYVNKRGGLLPYVKGIVSLTSKNAMGTGLVDMANADGANDPYAQALSDLATLKKRKQRAIKYNQKPKAGEPLLVPTLDPQGNISDYRYVMSEAHRIEYLDKETRMDHVIGNMYMRATDKIESVAIQDELTDLVWNDYRDNYVEESSSFVEVSNRSSDERAKEIFAMMPKELSMKLTERFGSSPIYVRKSQLSTVFGFRKVSISNLSLLQSIKPMARFTEKFIQDTVGVAAFNVVMKTTVLPYNILSNTSAGFLEAGVPLDFMMKEQVNAAVDLKHYLADQKKLLQLKFRLDARSANKSQGVKDKLKQAIKELEQEMSQNPAAILMNEHLLSSIIEDVTIDTNTDKYNLFLKLRKKVEGFVGANKSEIAKATYDYATLSKDTEILQLLVTATQYSDFAARMAVYKWIMKDAGTLTEAKRKSLHKEAVGRVSDLFIDYNLPTDPYIQWMNDSGIMVFTKYQFRIQRALFRIIKTKLGNLLAFQAAQEATGIRPANVFDSFIPDGNLTNPATFMGNSVMYPTVGLMPDLF